VRNAFVVEQDLNQEVFPNFEWPPDLDGVPLSGTNCQNRYRGRLKEQTRRLFMRPASGSNRRRNVKNSCKVYTSVILPASFPETKRVKE